MTPRGRAPGLGSSPPGMPVPAAEGLATAWAQLREVVGPVARTVAGHRHSRWPEPRHPSETESKPGLPRSGLHTGRWGQTSPGGVTGARGYRVRVVHAQGRLESFVVIMVIARSWGFVLFVSVSLLSKGRPEMALLTWSHPGAEGLLPSRPGPSLESHLSPKHQPRSFLRIQQVHGEPSHEQGRETRCFNGISVLGRELDNS